MKEEHNPVTYSITDHPLKHITFNTKAILCTIYFTYLSIRNHKLRINLFTWCSFFLSSYIIEDNRAQSIDQHCYSSCSNFYQERWENISPKHSGAAYDNYIFKTTILQKLFVESSIKYYIGYATMSLLLKSQVYSISRYQWYNLQ